MEAFATVSGMGSCSYFANCALGATTVQLPPAGGLSGALAPRKRSSTLSTEPGVALKPREHKKSPLWDFSTRSVVRATQEVLDVPSVTSDEPVDHQQGSSLLVSVECDETPRSNLSMFSPDPPFTFDLSTVATAGGVSTSSSEVLVATPIMYQPKFFWFATSEEQERQFMDRAINATIVGAAGAYAVTKILTVDHDYWHGWTVYEILRYAPRHNWSAYELALKNNPVLAKMMISGTVYAVGDWIAQCYEGKPILDFSRGRLIRSGLVGFCLHGSLSHFYYQVCEMLFPFKGWWVVPLKVAFDQTIWSAFWNSIYFVTVGLLRLESPFTIVSELRATFWPLLTAGWKLWPFAHVITYGVIPVEQRLLWVDCMELIWVTILSMYSNEKAEARIQEAATDSPPIVQEVVAASRILDAVTDSPTIVQEMVAAFSEVDSNAER